MIPVLVLLTLLVLEPSKMGGNPVQRNAVGVETT
jgi:hypothetical protein